MVKSDGSIYFSDPWYGRMPVFGVERPRQLGFQGVYRIPPGGSYTFTLSAGCWDVGAGEVLSQNTWTEGYAKVTVFPGRTTTLQSR